MARRKSSGATEDESLELAVRLHAAAIHLLRRLRREDAALGISPARASALSVLAFGGPRTLGELAAAEQVTAPTMSRLVAALEADGLVAREPDPRDGRVVRLRATAAGLRLIERGRARRTARLAARLQALAPAERAALARTVALLEGLLPEL
ncbi:MAG TPA: MarR family transcriptional regulator [Thermoanaerobaculia bacterium]